MSGVTDLAEGFNRVDLHQSHKPPFTTTAFLSHPPSTDLSTISPSDKAATVFPSHVRATYHRNPTDRTGELVRLLDDISVVTHSISTCVTLSHISQDDAVDNEVVTQRLYSSLCHDGYACIILEKAHEAPLTFSDSALQGGYVLMLSALDVDPDAKDDLFCGTVFSVYKRRSPPSLPGRLEDLQQHVGNQVAAGYVLYASATTLCYTMHSGVYNFCLHPVARQYFLQPSLPLELPKDGVDLYIDYPNARLDTRLGAAALAVCAERGGKVFDNACLIANFSGSIGSGSLFVSHHVHLLCEAAPLALLVEQMGGKATDGFRNRVLGTLTYTHVLTLFNDSCDLPTVMMHPACSNPLCDLQFFNKPLQRSQFGV